MTTIDFENETDEAIVKEKYFIKNIKYEGSKKQTKNLPTEFFVYVDEDSDAEYAMGLVSEHTGFCIESCDVELVGVCDVELVGVVDYA